MNWIQRRIKEASDGRRDLDLSIGTLAKRATGTKDHLTEVPPEVLTFTHLTKLDLSEHQIKTLPAGFESLSNLRELSFKSNYGFELDPSRLPPSLESLNLSFTGNLSNISFGNLPRLRVLKIASSQSSEIPREILSLAGLEELDISFWPLKSLSKELNQLQKLRVLSIGNDREAVSIGPGILRKLKSLRRLDFWFLKSEAEANAIADAEALESIDLIFCKLDSIPDSWRKLRNLREFQLSRYPDSKAQAPSHVRGIKEFLFDRELWKLRLDGVNCNELMYQISSFRDMRDLSIGGCSLEVFPEGITNLEKLEDLRLSGTNLHAVPPAFAGLESLRNLNLSDNPMVAFPPEICGLTGLEDLWTHNCGFVEIPEEIGRLSELKQLGLGNNPLRRWPAGVFRLARLESLRMDDTGINVVPPEIEELRNLKDLSISGNAFQKWPVEVLALPALEELNLSNTGIAEIPRSIERMQTLKSLDLSKNRISSVPAEISRLPSLANLKVSENPIASPTPEIIAGGTAAIQDYFSALLEAPSGRLFEAKLIVVGGGEVGKTCLARKIVDPSFDIEKAKKEIETTRGIAIARWQTETNASKNFKINIWDFGGQEIYHATHQFFLTKRSLYLLVWDARREDHLQGFEYWLSVIRLLSDSSPVLVVLNKADVRIREIDQKSLKEKFNNIAGFLKVSALTGQGVSELIHAVKQHISMLPHVGDEWPSKWSRVRSILEEDGRNYIESEEYFGICRDAGLSPSQAETLSYYLHNLGVVLHFRDDPILQNLVILKPAWGTHAVYAVLDTKKIQERNGKFKFGDLIEIWGHTEFPRARHTELLQLMKRFELCFQLENSDNYIVPELLSERQPAFQWNETNALRFEYRYEFMPAGIITRFIARNHSQIDGELYWRNGVLLAWEGTRALVAAEPLNRKIKVSVVGRDTKATLAVIRREFELIHGTLNNPTVRQMISCNCSKCRSESDGRFFFDYHRLRGFQQNNIREIPCERSWETVSVEGLLGGVFDKSELSRALPQIAPGTQVYIEKIEHYYATGGDVMQKVKNAEASIRGPWFSGLFYLTALVTITLLLAIVAKMVPWWALPPVVIGGLLGVTVVGALQLRQDVQLSQKNFLTLMALAFRQLPLLKQVLPKSGEVSDKGDVDKSKA